MSRKPYCVYERGVFYYETDGMGIVHHSNYIRWFEEARIYYMAQRGCPYEKMEQAGIMIPVVSVDCKYHIPVKFGQTVLIRAQAEEFTGTRLSVAYEVRDKDTGKLHAAGHSLHCFVRASDFHPVRLTKEQPEMAVIFMDEKDPADSGDNDRLSNKYETTEEKP